ncbi:ectoine/hydroxyectoine ABC transporter permease subunit EhuC [Tabrizicola sp.]|uniref:ectoine/hydroxyectoine ABC transporter permease subunit EhuC n=1 Tax=Tabrizicola sp. TaxID=2005166 RepID=UPI0027330B11|nr:ectoine/hydroxyectoine ABC transporter permease subunit EhuC [Tabrizicola sp.]MDP3196209.1 ectoine/hydroxyectoine ABC transporter permease subunit EhuC [Tabrizicola sp.]MDZ4086278.1 ectoine/hydroxyectoine ABC transporter permease subunit EhuC [Tabrizicola sp.]
MWEFLQTYGPRLLDGALVTCAQFILAALVACVAALAAGLGRLSSLWPVRSLSVVYIELFRGTSLLVQLYWIFFVLPLFGISLPKFEAGFLSVGLNVGAYGAEIVRGAIQAVPRGQWEAGYALSMSPAKRMRRIILPQALVLMLPPWGNLMIELLKGTALVALIAVPDLMFVAKQINGATFRSAEAFGAALVIYYLLARVLITPAMRGLERAMARRLGRA